LADAPRRAGVVPGDFLDHRYISRRRQLGAAQGSRQQQTEQATPGEGVDHRLGQLAPALDLLRGSGELRPELARASEMGRTPPPAGIRRRNRSLHPRSCRPRASSRSRFILAHAGRRQHFPLTGAPGRV
jgi:hypothetical protein